MLILITVHLGRDSQKVLSLRFLLNWDSQKVFSKILAETKFVQKVFSSINTPNMLFKIIKQICYFICKIM